MRKYLVLGESRDTWRITIDPFSIYIFNLSVCVCVWSFLNMIFIVSILFSETRENIEHSSSWLLLLCIFVSICVLQFSLSLNEIH